MYTNVSSNLSGTYCHLIYIGNGTDVLSMPAQLIIGQVTTSKCMFFNIKCKHMFYYITLAY